MRPMVPLVAQVSVPTPPPREVRHAVGRVSAVLLVLALIGIVAVCALALIAMRRRTRAQDQTLSRSAGPSDQTDAWAESARRMTLEDDEDIPREPGSA